MSDCFISRAKAAPGRHRPQAPCSKTSSPFAPIEASVLSTLATRVFLDLDATQGINDALAREVATVYAAEVFERRLRDADVELLLVTSGGYAVGFVDIAFASRCLGPEVRGAEVLLKRRRGP